MIIVAVAISSIYTANAQVAINTDGTDPNPSAMLDVISTIKGFLPPRMSTAQMNDITSPPAGLMIYNTTINYPAFFNGTEWLAALKRDGEACDSISYDGQTYHTTIVGFQCWMTENLNFDTANSWCFGENSLNCDTYGRLYTWTAAKTACPPGWHLPSDDEWKTLEMHLGMSQNQADSIGWRGTDEGEKLKSMHLWHNYGNGNDWVDFTGLPGGSRSPSNSWESMFYGGYWWSSTSYDATSAWIRYLWYSYKEVKRTHADEGYGFSVRCVSE